VRRAAAAAEPPPLLGEPPAGPSEGTDGPVPPHVARAQAAQAACWDLGGPAVGGTGGALRGVGVGGGTHTGPALVVTGRGDELGALRPGHVLVATTTTAADDPLFAVVGAVATEHGNLLSHAAITAREHGLPAVVGVAGLLDAVAPGALVEVDGVAGTVRVVP
jgi:pyruvate,water dikinase